MREPFLNVLVHVTNICGNVLTLNSGDALTNQDLKHLQHLDSGKFWWLWTSLGFVHLWPRFIVTSWLQQHVKSHHPWMWWRNELCSHTMYFSILIALNPLRCTTFCTASVNTSGTRGITTYPHPPWTSDGKMRLATHSLVAMNFDWSTFCMSVDLTGSKVRMRNFSSRLRPALLGLTWSLSSCAWVATRPCPIATCFLKLKKFLALGFRTFKFCRSSVFSYLITSSALGSSCTMTKRDSSFAGITYPSSSMSMPRRLSWRSRDHGQSSSTAAPSDSLHPSRSDNAPQAGPSISPTGLGEYTSHYGYSSANLATPIPSPADHQAPILFSLILQGKHIHSSTRWQKSDVSSMHTILSRSNHLQMTTPNRHFADLWWRKLIDVATITIGNRNTFSMASSATFVPARMAGLTHGINPPSSPSTGVAIFRFRRSLRMEIGILIKMKLQKALIRCMNPAWMTPILSLPMLTLLHLLSRSINWQRSSGTFSTMTGRPIWPFSNASRILKMTFPDTQFRSSRRQIWLTLPVTWRNLQGLCQTKHVAWRHCLTKACEL